MLRAVAGVSKEAPIYRQHHDPRRFLYIVATFHRIMGGLIEFVDGWIATGIISTQHLSALPPNTYTRSFPATKFRCCLGVKKRLTRRAGVIQMAVVGVGDGMPLGGCLALSRSCTIRRGAAFTRMMTSFSRYLSSKNTNNYGMYNVKFHHLFMSYYIDVLIMVCIMLNFTTFLCYIIQMFSPKNSRNK